MSASTTLLADANSMINTGPSAASIIAAAGVVPATGAVSTLEGGAPGDPIALLNLYKTKIQEAKKILQDLSALLVSADPILTTVTNDLATLV